MAKRKSPSSSLRGVFAQAGGRIKLADELGITPQALSQWKKVPVSRVLDVERATGIPREELRPDIFRPENEAGRAA